jgi:dTDP-N-acetylfucosamine:lipid II N-acetylfucosaminyltransferase
VIRIIHIFDDDKFVDPTIKLFEEVIPTQSIYYIIKSKGASFKYVKSNNVSCVDFSKDNEKKDLLDFINSNDNHVVFLHALEINKQNLVLGILPNIKKVWFIWGYDLYPNWPLLNQKIYLAKTKSIIDLKGVYKDKLIHNSFSFYLFKKRHLLQKINKRIYNILSKSFESRFYRAASLIDYVVPVVPTEYAIIKDMNLRAKFAPFTYGCIEDLLGNKLHESVANKKNILVGNSADPSNNHLEVFYELSKMDLKNRKVFVPLSYSGNSNYKESVIELGYQLLGSNFYPLLDFMTLEEYNDILLSCGTMIFNHIRQQGVGNIITLGYLGATIFLNHKSPVYSYYNSLGLKIFNTNDIFLKSSYVLNDEEIKINQKILFNLYSRNAVHDKINTLVKIVS